MTTWDYFRSAVIFMVAVFLINRLFELDFFECITLVSLMMVCIFHTIDVREHIYQKVAERRIKRDRE